jgi:hypothetical protein
MMYMRRGLIERRMFPGDELRASGNAKAAHFFEQSFSRRFHHELLSAIRELQNTTPSTKSERCAYARMSNVRPARNMRCGYTLKF